MRPRWPPDLSKRALGLLLVDFWTDFGRFLDRIWSIFGLILVDCWTNGGRFSDQVSLIFVNLFDRCLDKCCLMFQHILVILFSALLDVWAYVGHVAHVPLSSNPQARWRVWPEGQLDIYIYIYIYIVLV